MLYFQKWKIYLILGVCGLSIILTLPNFASKRFLDSLPMWMPHRQISLGLDLRGGSSLLLEVDMATVLRDRLGALVDSTRTKLNGASVGYSSLSVVDQAVQVRLRETRDAVEAMRVLKELVTMVGGGPLGGGEPDLIVTQTSENLVALSFTEVALRDRSQRAIEQSIEIVRRRIDETGVNEPTIARQGDNRILVQLPGIDDPDRVKRLLGQTAKMTFRLLDPNGMSEGGRPPPGSESLPSAEGDRRYGGAPTQYIVRRKVEVDGANLSNARAGQNNQTGEWVVNFEFDAVGGRRFAEVTKVNVGRPFAIVLDNKVISAPVIREPITGGRGQISGHFSAQSASDLAVLLRAGALPAPLTVVEERTVGPDLGTDAIRAGIYSVMVGFALVVTYMILAYGLFGIFANLALLFNLVLIVAALSVLQATLTLPGIAGILLTLGMAVDANILVNERIREETRKGKSAFAAMEAGYSRAFSTILDANLTALIKMFILFVLGSGAVKGFAVTISLGIVTSMFTALVLVRLMMVTWLRRTRPAMLPV
ncbi:Protein translocase subunit SecD [uncultured Gammaproteobacteria bacterium]